MSRNSTILQAPPTPVNATSTAVRPTEEDIAFRAHQIFLERGATPGQDLDDWLQAERELTAAAERLNPPKKAAPPPIPLPNPRFPR